MADSGSTELSALPSWQNPQHAAILALQPHERWDDFLVVRTPLLLIFLLYWK